MEKRKIFVDVDDVIAKINNLCSGNNENWIGTENQSFVDHADVINVLEEACVIDAVEVVRCRNCIMHGNCSVEDAFNFARVEDPFCCAGKEKSQIV